MNAGIADNISYEFSCFVGLPEGLEKYDDINNPQPSTSGLPNRHTHQGQQTSTDSTVSSKPESSARKSGTIISPPSMLPADNPGFMSEFYSNSRLHHISHWRTHLKDVVGGDKMTPRMVFSP